MKYICLLLLLVPVVCFSQDNYLQGYIIKSNGETIKGYINYTFKEFTPLYIIVKEDASASAVKTYSPEQLNAFQIDGKGKYITYHGRISMDKNRFPYISPLLDTPTIQNFIFLRTVYSGKKVSLFAQSDELKTRYFVAEGNATPQELKFYYYFDSNKNINRQVPIYKGQLIILAQKYNIADNRIMKRLEDLAFEENGLKRITAFIDQNDK